MRKHYWYGSLVVPLQTIEVPIGSHKAQVQAYTFGATSQESNFIEGFCSL